MLSRISAVTRQITVPGGPGSAYEGSAVAPSPPGVSGACPLLEDGLCSIYASRPLICRAYGFCAEEGGVYTGCDILAARLRGSGEIALPSLDAARALLPDETLLDANGLALPSNSTLPELLERLLALPDRRR